MKINISYTSNKDKCGVIIIKDNDNEVVLKEEIVLSDEVHKLKEETINYIYDNNNKIYKNEKSKEFNLVKKENISDFTDVGYSNVIGISKNVNSYLELKGNIEITFTKKLFRLFANKAKKELYVEKPKKEIKKSTNEFSEELKFQFTKEYRKPEVVKIPEKIREKIQKQETNSTRTNYSTNNTGRSNNNYSNAYDTLYGTHFGINSNNLNLNNLLSIWILYQNENDDYLFNRKLKQLNGFEDVTVRREFDNLNLYRNNECILRLKERNDSLILRGNENENIEICCERDKLKIISRNKSGTELVYDCDVYDKTANVTLNNDYGLNVNTTEKVSNSVLFNDLENVVINYSNKKEVNIDSGSSLFNDLENVVNDYSNGKEVKEKVDSSVLFSELNEVKEDYAYSEKPKLYGNKQEESSVLFKELEDIKEDYAYNEPPPPPPSYSYESGDPYATQTSNSSYGM